MPIKKVIKVVKVDKGVLAPKKTEDKIKEESVIKKIKVLVVEDDFSIATMYKVAFENDGFTFFTTDKGEEAIKIAETERPDAILLDIILPQWDGFTILTNLKKNDKTKGIPVMMLDTAW